MPSLCRCQRTLAAAPFLRASANSRLGKPALDLVRKDHIRCLADSQYVLRAAQPTGDPVVSIADHYYIGVGILHDQAQTFVGIIEFGGRLQTVDDRS